MRAKVLLVGEEGVGKTSIRDRLCQNYFNPFSVKTVGVQFSSRSMVGPLEDQLRRFTLCFWDMAGDHPSPEQLPAFFKNAMGVIYVFDLTRAQSLSQLRHWREHVEEHRNGKAVSMLLACKKDLRLLREVSRERAEEAQRELGADYYFEVSAMDERGGVEEAVLALFRGITQQCRFGVKLPLRLKKSSYHSPCI